MNTSLHYYMLPEYGKSSQFTAHTAHTAHLLGYTTLLYIT
jgi:hypothetical protein